ncbi:hypothetical protein QJS04_geneDACA002031 [Acorus gramineus]|uniref:Uncharacterized protein n=1 Tax=Acorus gramineus TaxID=55184 RepID=A0AAV9A8K4_ACOGR|nr:hypothetical protein QJS04_geneDACA002031 [Acorus gramineus]
MEMQGIQQKMIVNDNSMQMMIKGDEEIKANLDESLKAIPNQLRKSSDHQRLQDISSVISTMPDQIEACLLRFQGELCNMFTKEVQVMANSIKHTRVSQPTSTIQPSERKSWNSTRSMPSSMMEITDAPLKAPRSSLILKMEPENLTSVRRKQASFTATNHKSNVKHEEILLIEQEKKIQIIIDSDEEFDGAFSCLLDEKKPGTGTTLAEEAKKRTLQILRKARKRKRKKDGVIILV